MEAAGKLAAQRKAAELAARLQVESEAQNKRAERQNRVSACGALDDAYLWCVIPSMLQHCAATQTCVQPDY